MFELLFMLTVFGLMALLCTPIFYVVYIAKLYLYYKPEGKTLKTLLHDIWLGQELDDDELDEFAAEE